MEGCNNIGMQSFNQALYKLFAAKKSSLEEALRNADSRTNVALKIKLDMAGDSDLVLHSPPHELHTIQYPDEQIASAGSGDDAEGNSPKDDN